MPFKPYTVAVINDLKDAGMVWAYATKVTTADGREFIHLTDAREAEESGNVHDFIVDSVRDYLRQREDSHPQ